ncbi:MAG: HAMP domain-containing sensor histidine kinase [Bacteroidia bacterium]|nr:HAMP domain-containing sensor histidine kinase [Bacteroidia bacterium]
MTINNYEIKKVLKVVLLVFAFFIGFFSLWYTNNLVDKLAEREREKIATWADATRILATSDLDGDVNFLLRIIETNTTIPVVLTNAEGVVNGQKNLDSSGYHGADFMAYTIRGMKKKNEPLEIEYMEGQTITIYYGNSKLLNQLSIYPYFQLGVIGLFLAISYFAFSYSRTSEQNKVWAGMSKETAHQLGTPISSLMGWIDYIKASDVMVPPKVLKEIEHDMERLGLITERFSKIGSEPSLTDYDLLEVLDESVSYINARTSDKVDIALVGLEKFKGIRVAVNKPLFAWVVENLCKNAVDAMDGQGEIRFEIAGVGDEQIQFDVVDTGRGVPSNKQKTIFKPGYTTKKRGWGLGLSLVKRIIQNYHNGKIYIKSSTLGKGTRFRIELRKA